MNRSSLNSITLGAGGRTSFVRLAATQVMQMAGALGVSLRKYGSAVTTMAVSGDMRVLGYIRMKLLGSHALSGDFAPGVWRRVYGSVVQFSQLVGGLALTRYALLSGRLEALLVGGAVPSTWHHSPGAMSGTCALVGILTGVDIYSGEAPQTRRVALCGETRRVSVLGSVTSVGV